MKLGTHVANMFLHDNDFLLDIIAATYKEGIEVPEQVENKITKSKVNSLYDLINPKENKNYYVTNTVLDKLDMLKVNTPLSWTIFKSLKALQKKTFIFPNNTLLRIKVYENYIAFFHLTRTKNEPTNMYIFNDKWVMLYVDQNTGVPCEHFESADGKQIDTLIYKLLCFIYFSENEEIIVEPGRKYGTQKSGKLINEFSEPVIIINSKWNITSIRTEGFPVKGHFAMRWTGEGRSIPKMVFINPYEKHGYVRRSQAENI